MAWRTYRWDDAGAPQLSATGSALILLLDAVLIGTAGIAYGSKPSAGWTGSNLPGSKAKYINAGSGHGILVTHLNSVNLPVVVGIENGDENGNLFPTAAQVASPVWGISNTTDGTTRPWIIFADEKRFILWVGYNLTTGQALSASTTFQQMYFAGDIFRYKGTDTTQFMVASNSTVALNSNPFGSCQSSLGATLAIGHYMPRSHTQAAGSVQVGKLSDYSYGSNLSSGNVTSIPYPDPLSGGLVISPIRIFESNIYGARGVLPGVWFVQHSMPGNNGDTFNGAPTGPLAGKSFMLLDACSQGSRVRFAIETSDTIGL